MRVEILNEKEKYIEHGDPDLCYTVGKGKYDIIKLSELDAEEICDPVLSFIDILLHNHSENIESSSFFCLNFNYNIFRLFDIYNFNKDIYTRSIAFYELIHKVKIDVDKKEAIIYFK